MTARTLALVLTLAATVLAIAATLPPVAPRGVFGVAVSLGALLYLAAGAIPRAGRPPIVVVGIRAGSVVMCWKWPASPKPVTGR